MDARGGAGRALELGRAPDVIEMGVRVDDGSDRDAEGIEARADCVVVAARVDDDGALGVEVGDDGAVAPERADDEGFDVHAERSSTPRRADPSASSHAERPAPGDGVVGDRHRTIARVRPENLAQSFHDGRVPGIAGNRAIR